MPWFLRTNLSGSLSRVSTIALATGPRSLSFESYLGTRGLTRIQFSRPSGRSATRMKQVASFARPASCAVPRGNGMERYSSVGKRNVTDGERDWVMERSPRQWDLPAAQVLALAQRSHERQCRA